MALPGFIEYLFYGYEQKASRDESFFGPQVYENSRDLDSRMDESGYNF